MQLCLSALVVHILNFAVARHWAKTVEIVALERQQNLLPPPGWKAEEVVQTTEAVSRVPTQNRAGHAEDVAATAAMPQEEQAGGAEIAT
eukprot:3225237-Amphidinium_carterae.1